MIHDWGDAEAVTILRNCRRVLGGRGRLLLVEAVVEPGRLSPAAASLDLRMLAMVGEARQRDITELTALLGQSGLRLTRHLPTTTEFSVLEAVPG